jgi:hypothetical protein
MHGIAGRQNQVPGKAADRERDRERAGAERSLHTGLGVLDIEQCADMLINRRNGVKTLSERSGRV